MFNATTSRNKATKALALCCGAAVMVGSLALFTDRLTSDSAATAGNIDLVWEDTSLKANSNNEFAQDDAWDKKALVTAGNIINPGDHFDLSYDLTNDGSKSVRVRQKIVLTSSKELTSVDAAEYALTITGGNDAAAVVPTIDGSKKVLTYELSDIIMVGSTENNIASGGHEEGAVEGKYDIQLDFSEAAKNAFMDSTVDVDLYVAAVQARNTEFTDLPAFDEMNEIMANTGWETISK